jgi:Probable cobalt transporter subunit (CbtB)
VYGSKARPSIKIKENYHWDAPSQEASIMAQFAAGTVAQPVSIPVVPLRELLPWAVFGGLLMLLAIYFVGAEQGATSLIHGRAVHEFLHDGRHLLGFPCH